MLARRDSARISPGTLVERAAERWPDRPAVKCGARTLTYSELNARAARWAAVLAGRGIAKGDTVAVLVENRIELLICLAAVAKLGAISALINTSQRRRALAHSFGVAAPRAVVLGSELTAAYEDVRAEFVEPALLFGLHDAPGDALPEGFLALEELARAVPAGAALTTGEVRLHDPIFQVFTSGTTGLPKASIMSGARWVRSGAAIGKGLLQLNETETIYVPLPLYHNVALTLGWASALMCGSAIAIRREFSASAFWDDVRRYEASAFCYVGEMCRYLLNQPPTPGDADNTIRRAVGVGLRPEIWDQFKDRLGIGEIYELYGASESSGAFINFLNLDKTIGLAATSYALVRFDEETGEPERDVRGRCVRVRYGDPGLMLAKVGGRVQFDGYTDREATEKKIVYGAFRADDAWFNTGDLLRNIGYRHARFVDRIGDTFRWKSENVSTIEVEAVFNADPFVLDAAVYGVHVEGASGRAGMAAVVLQQAPGQALLKEAALKDLAARLRAQLPSHAVPVFLRLVSEIEVTGTFKHKKHILREQGCDPTLVGDPLYALLKDSDTYVALTPALFRSIVSGARRI